MVELEKPDLSLTYAKWIVCDNDCDFFLRNDGSGLGNGSATPDMYLFETKLDAYSEAKAYYERINVPYPYEADYLRVLQSAGKVPAQFTEGSQIMEFI